MSLFVCAKDTVYPAFTDMVNGHIGDGIMWMSPDKMFPVVTAFLFILLKLLIAFLILFFLIPFWKMGVCGGGDIKLVAMSSIMLGICGCINAFIYALFWAVFITALLLIRSAYNPGKKIAKRGKLHIIHFSVPLLLGLMTYCFVGDLISFSFL